MESNLSKVRQAELESNVKTFDEKARKNASHDEEVHFDGLVRAAQNAINNDEPGFDNRIAEISDARFKILWKQDSYVVELFYSLVIFSHNYSDKALFEELKEKGTELIKNDRIDELRFLIFKLVGIRISDAPIVEPVSAVNVVKG